MPREFLSGAFPWSRRALGDRGRPLQDQGLDEELHHAVPIDTGVASIRAHLNLEALARLLQRLDELHGEGKTILMVTHENAVAARAERELHLKDGYIHEVQERASRETVA